jgi:hypothetical protein
MIDLVGAAEVAELLGVSRQRDTAIVKTHADFPAAVAELKAGRIWRRDEVERWAQEWRSRRPRHVDD